MPGQSVLGVLLRRDTIAGVVSEAERVDGDRVVLCQGESGSGASLDACDQGRSIGLVMVPSFG